MDHIEDYQDRLLFAIPKKGRLHEKCVTLLNNVDIQFHRKPRHDIALVQNFPIALIFLPASDIAKYVGEGNVDLGITGQDIVAESEAEDKVNIIQKLGFGKCKLQVQTPARNQIQSADTLIGQRIVTSFPVVTKKYFNELEKNNSSESKTQIRFVGGSVETACALGLAQGIVDLVESGETMRAAGLEAIATILESEAVLISNFNTKHPDLVKKIQARIEGSLLANKYVICTYNSPRSMLQECIKITPGRKAPTLSPLEDKEWVSVSVMVESSKISDIMDQLTAIGASDIMVTKLVNCRA